MITHHTPPPRMITDARVYDLGLTPVSNADVEARVPDSYSCPPTSPPTMVPTRPTVAPTQLPTTVPTKEPTQVRERMMSELEQPYVHSFCAVQQED